MVSASSTAKPDPGLDRYEFRTEAPNWVNLPAEAEYHVGVIEQGTDEQYYKALIMLENGQQRWWVWNEEGRMPYGPDLPPAIIKMLVGYMDKQ